MRQTSDERRRAARQTADGHQAAERPPGAEEAGPSASATGSAAVSEIDAEIRRRAFDRYAARGDGPGSDVEDWCAAEREVHAERGTPRSGSA
ncbi:DUF2934 domain-containing protein [Roseisolibacter sp. H3M3-2]|uniref:DUF2934 domain-containing protein n=1 Tax=Roseisolibacter sp. H3M3-2 TaxID=3031323 RepID=UPI0023DACDFC|nr:DUF2934 domain-containing protein [Roseisolibacter sp. H3M3-2]MDF1502416.1 DUF2934 domain-containing protein [Roseisolibacter sp. H3M3-2]